MSLHDEIKKMGYDQICNISGLGLDISIDVSTCNSSKGCTSSCESGCANGCYSCKSSSQNG